MKEAFHVYVEATPKRAFASAIEWPGWSRGGRTEEAALESLVAYGPRYAPVATRARVRFTPPAHLSGLVVVERLNGGASTDFGVPSLPASDDGSPIDPVAARRLIALLQASWDTFDDIASSAVGVELRKGPRGGGRDLDKIAGHVFQAESSYLVQLGAKRLRLEAYDVAAGWSTLRHAEVEAFGVLARGEPLAQANRVKSPWSPRYFVRRAAWHVLDHAWEIEDRVILPVDRWGELSLTGEPTPRSGE